MDNNFENEIPKYQKRSTRQPPKKSKHKHLYKDCLLKSKEGRFHKSEYCSICGKIGETWFFETKPSETGRSVILTQEELYEKYKNLEIFNVDSLWDKYVAITIN